ncbi:MAG TPA: rod shape-determining protein MreD [Streptosporangiaceae bacterium]|nr:rod shape-determining protein MreD [Streptosporangiaceae bacterium]
MRRALISLAVVLVALIAQVTIVNRLALPGGSGPDLVLLAVVALALTGGPMPGMLTGFLAGLALDVAPPASHTIGQYALVFCLVGYFCGRLSDLGDASPALYVAISAAAAAVGAALTAVLGVMLSDPEVTWAAVRHVLPPSLVYDVILSPFVLYGVVKLDAWAGSAAAQEGAPAAGSATPGWLAGAAGAGPAAGAVRQTSKAATPRLRLGDRHSSDAWIGAGAAATRLGAGRPAGKREPRLRFNGARGTGAVASTRQRSAHRRLAGLTGAGPAPRMRFKASGNSLTSGKTAPRATAPRMRFGGSRRDGLIGGKAAYGRGRSGAVPRFRRRGVMGTIGTGGSLGRGALRGGSLRRGPAPRLRMRRGTMRSKVLRLVGRGTGGYR